MVLSTAFDSVQQALESRPYILLAVLVVICYLAFQALVTSQANRVYFPIVGVRPHKLFPKLRARLEYIQHGGRMILDGYRNNPDQILQIPTINQMLILLPSRYIEEIKSQPEEVISSSWAVSDYFMGDWTTLNILMFGHTLWDTLLAQFTRHIGDQVKPLDDEIRYCFEDEFSSCPEWTAVVVLPKILRMVAQSTARLTVGLPICRDKNWVHITSDYAICVFRSAAVFKMTPAIIRPILSLFLPYMHRIRRHHREARKLIIPEIFRRRSARDEEEKSGSDRQKDTLHWLEEMSHGEHSDPQRMVHRLLGISFAATHTTTNHITNTIFDLATRWDEYAEELRQEIVEVTGGFQNRITDKATLTRLSKLDSFMKESQRLNPASSLSMNRKMMEDFTLSDGTVLPRNSYISVPSGPMSVSPLYHKKAEVFDGFRYHRMRQDPAGNPNTGQFSTTAHSGLQFGHGRFACPGRFFASMQSKLILVHVIMNYDLKLVEGEGRPENVRFVDANVPNPGQRILFRDRAMA